jgi:hypothetical protein
MATLAKSIVKLREQINARYPNRSKSSDGTWPSAAHRRASPNSDHNTGHAIDFTHDPRGGLHSEKLADHLRITHDPRLKYIISNRKIASAKTGWKWVRYKGANAHDKHVHISVNRAPDNGNPWSLPPVAAPIRAGFLSTEAEEGVTANPEVLAAQSDEDGVDEVADEMTENEGDEEENKSA